MNRINNKPIYNVFIGINIFVVFLLLFSVGFFIFAINSGVKNPFKYYHLQYYPILLFLYSFVRFKFTPCYFEAEISNQRIIIKTINPSKYYGLKFIHLVFNKVKPSEFIIDRTSFTNYRILIEKWGLKKSLILQKSVNGIVFDSKPIMIVFLGYKKYTDLIISLERLCQKMSLN